MAAEFNIHVLEGATEDDLAAFFVSSDAYDVVAKTPSVTVGDVSWLKAAVFEDDDTFIPDPIGKIAELIGEDLPVCDDALIAQITAALNVPNRTDYELKDSEKVIAFLNAHKGKRLFHVSW